ncbi:hypothetical protein G6F23_014054 [Rhizopus arrhizus]|nr:hypothetical protein G6F23_014054 [Rhizopus arrhizus]
MDIPVYALAIGVMIGGVAQLAVQWIALSRLGLTPRFSLRFREAWADPTVQRILKQMAPATLGVSVAQISLLINTNIATWLTPGSVTWLSFADRLMEFPTALLGVALAPCWTGACGWCCCWGCLPQWAWRCYRTALSPPCSTMAPSLPKTCCRPAWPSFPIRSA